jgi:Na+/proline symporter
MLAALSPVDYGVVALYAGALVAIGLYASSRQKTSTEFLLAGRSLGWLPLGLSLVATLSAGLVFTDLPAEAYEHGLLCWLLPAAIWIVLPIVVFLLAPLYRGLALDSLFEYLEYRFDARVRLLASLLYTAWRLLWLVTILAAASHALAIATGSRLPAWAIIIPLGGLATLYTFLGGMRTVAAGGAVHAGVMAAGVLIVIGGLLWHMGHDPARVAEVARKLGRMQVLEFDSQWTSGWSLWALLPHAFFASLAFCTADQAAGQRLLSARGVNDARTAFLTGTLGISLLWFALIYCGLGLLAFYQEHPRALRPEWVVNVDGRTRQQLGGVDGRELLDPANPAHAVTWENIHQLVAERRILRPNDKLPFTSADELIDPDQNRLLVEKLAMRKSNEGTFGGEWIVREGMAGEMLPHFVATQLPWGLAGIALAAILAGSLAAIDASLCALAATLVFDLHRRFGLLRREATSPATELQLARPLTLVLGAVVTAAAVVAVMFSQHLATLLAIAGALGAPLLGVFLLGLVTRRATAVATLVAAVAGLVGSIALLSPTRQIVQSWDIVASTLFTFLVGYVLSFILGRRKTNQELRGLVTGCGTLGIRAHGEAVSGDLTPDLAEPPRWR